MKNITGSITAPKGFRAASMHCGIKKKRPDLALVVSDVAATAAGVFTANKFQAAPVQVSREYLSGGSHRAVIINSGNANCLTGKGGITDAVEMSKATALALGCRKDDVLVCSTGIIGRRLPVGKIVKALPKLVSLLSKQDPKKVAEAIMTTDTFRKDIACSINIGGRQARIGAMAKGAGMIAPNMATMLCIMTTDVKIGKGLLKRALKAAVEDSFNSITVDGDMSTNDTVLILANGLSGVDIGSSSAAYNAFVSALKAVCLELAKMIVRDGEGATKFIEIEVKNARSSHQAKRCALGIANSPLFKTMCYGQDPNFGRVASACGASYASIVPSKVDIYLNGKLLVKSGVARQQHISRSLLKPRDIKVRVALNTGTAGARVFTSDLTPEYVRINAAYS